MNISSCQFLLPLIISKPHCYMWFNLSFFIQAIQALLVPGYFPPTCKAHCETNGENNEISKSRFVFIIMVTNIIIIPIAILIITVVNVIPIISLCIFFWGAKLSFVCVFVFVVVFVITVR